MRRLISYAVVAGLLAIAWAAWYFGFSLRGRRARPFARAERELRRQLVRGVEPSARRAAMRSLHRAFDATAGSTVFAESLRDFFDRCPTLAPAHDAVERFFAASRAEFFGEGRTDADFACTDLLALAKQLKALEREAG